MCFGQVQYQREPVEALRGLWEQVNGSGHTSPWDLSLNTLGQVRHNSYELTACALRVIIRMLRPQYVIYSYISLYYIIYYIKHAYSCI